MKNKLLLPLASVLIVTAVLLLLFTYLVNDTFERNKSLNGLELVNENDIVKSTQDFLEGIDSETFPGLLEEYNLKLVLYDPSGTVIFDSSNQYKPGERGDVSKVLSGAGMDNKVAMIRYTKDNTLKNALAVISNNRRTLDPDDLKQKIKGLFRIFSALCILLVLTILFYINLYILRPFKKLEHFAGEVARGNLDIPLIHNRRNFFGAFTWAFDMLRTELKTSKEREAEAERTKKELVAALSHDLRTPIAAIRAYAECLKGLPDKNSQRGDKYIGVILEKTDEISKLSQDMFLHAISDLERLEIVQGEYQSRELLNDIIEPLMLQYENRIVITEPFPDVTVVTDRIRLAQVFENIVSNTAKYSPGSDIQIMSYQEDGMVVCCFRDFGKGVPPEDIPFLFDKFFRGSNARESGQPGSGLGLYISRYILEKTGGYIRAFNFCENDVCGFAVEAGIRCSRIRT